MRIEVLNSPVLAVYDEKLASSQCFLIRLLVPLAWRLLGKQALTVPSKRG